MHFDVVDWDDEDFDRGNTRHIAANGVTPAVSEEVLDAIAESEIKASRSDPDHSTAVGETGGGRLLRIVFEIEVVGGYTAIRPITAYDSEH